GMHPFLGSDRHAYYGRIANARHVVEHALDVFWKDVEPFRGHDHFLFPPANVQLAVRADLADVAGVEPTVVERACCFFSRVEVAAGHVLTSHKNLAVGSDLHFDPGDRL